MPSNSNMAAWDRKTDWNSVEVFTAFNSKNDQSDTQGVISQLHEGGRCFKMPVKVNDTQKMPSCVLLKHANAVSSFDWVCEGKLLYGRWFMKHLLLFKPSSPIRAQNEAQLILLLGKDLWQRIAHVSERNATYVWDRSILPWRKINTDKWIDNLKAVLTSAGKSHNRP